MSADGSITAAELAALMRDLLPIGLDATTGATTRLAWTPEEERAQRWFGDRAHELGRRVERDPAGICGPCRMDRRRGGRWGRTWTRSSPAAAVDGALGVAVAFAVGAREPVAVVAFADEEGARFNTPTFGSRALVGRLDIDDAMQRSDVDGELLRDAFLAGGLDPDELASASRGLERVRGLLELHIDQTRDVAHMNAPVAVVSGLAARMRMQAVVQGRADHAGTTQREERHDALAAAARLIVRGEELSEGGMLFTAARIEVEPKRAEHCAGPRAAVARRPSSQPQHDPVVARAIGRLRRGHRAGVRRDGRAAHRRHVGGSADVRARARCAP